MTRRKKPPPQYPIGTVAMYGPDDKTTTKIAAGVILHDGAEPILKRWVDTDVTTNPKVQQELQDFFLQHGVKQVAMTEGNLGCPHEEGEASSSTVTTARLRTGRQPRPTPSGVVPVVLLDPMPSLPWFPCPVEYPQQSDFFRSGGDHG
jgi:hypothetical protein